MAKYLKYGYLIIISAVLPLYMERGYYQLGERKGIAFMVIGLFFALLFLLVQNRKFIQTDKLPSHLSYGLCVFLFSNILTFIYSMDKKISFLGLSGWRFGLVSILLMVFFFYVFYDGEKISGYVLAAVMITPFLEAILSIANRFSIYPFEIYGRDPAFLATIGNINWLVGYFSVFVPLGIGLCYTRDLFSRQFFLCAVYVLVTLTALMLQGSDSATLVVAASFVVLLFFSIGERQSFRKYLALVFILGLSMESACILYMNYEKSYSYTENLPLTVCNMHVGLILMAFVFFIFCISHLFEAVGFSFLEKTYRYIAGFIVALLLLTAAYYVLISFDYKMGNGRGLIYSMSIDMFGRMDPVRMLFGAGQDCYSVYAYSDLETADSLLNIFGGNILTNAHCAPLTILIERGLFGLFSYILLIALLAKEILAQKNKHARVISALILSSYLINSFVSFDLVISTPYLFLALAICLSQKEVMN
ncbi:hypothetical protein D6855_12015 [Butyrivibrio sp. CB08]|uniref:O-antigen ligase family protein n=1 Tax=Butyrivibrio sp. CB08 TaxID=2364879 RepID=UPI000EAA9514|nr:O-antigen ligase family protein [Butyrivibrio sp. CB08]RKM58876.1 hypothetical protein D6855_12015 [Butyrivibrio sp. CB08]